MKLFLSILLVGIAAAVQILGAVKSTSDCHDISFECPKMKNLCNDTNYAQIMKAQCPETCGFCGVAPTAPNGVCIDNPDYNCAELAEYCDVPDLKDELRLNCPVTCGACPKQA